MNNKIFFFSAFFAPLETVGKPVLAWSLFLKKNIVVRTLAFLKNL